MQATKQNHEFLILIDIYLIHIYISLMYSFDRKILIDGSAKYLVIKTVNAKL